MKWIKIKVWLLRYALEFKRQTGWSFRQSWDYGKATAENFNYDLKDLCCPINMVQEDLSCWSD